MKIRHSKSHITRNCTVCKAPTRGSKIYEEGGISIRVPVCEREEGDCHTKVFVKESAKIMLRQLKQEVTV